MSLTSPSNHVVTISSTERWEIYRRLQELQIPCQCFPHQPLQVQILDPTAAIQLWSVVQQVTKPRCELVGWLYRCWHEAQ